MRRPSIDCRRAAHSIASPPLQHIWISDDLLTRTFHQFFHQFFHRECAHQRRHGSHVPGPLEARRRAVKRRMTAQAHVSPPGGVPLPFSFGALLGYKSSSQPVWRYEPPSMPKQPRPMKQSVQTQLMAPETTVYPPLLPHPHKPHVEQALLEPPIPERSLQLSASEEQQAILLKTAHYEHHGDPTSFEPSVPDTYPSSSFLGGPQTTLLETKSQDTYNYPISLEPRVPERIPQPPISTDQETTSTSTSTSTSLETGSSATALETSGIRSRSKKRHVAKARMFVMRKWSKRKKYNTKIEKKAAQAIEKKESAAQLVACLSRFKMRISKAHEIPNSNIFDFLSQAIKSCCPVGKHAGKFTLLALQHLRRSRFTSNVIVSCLVRERISLPNLGTPESFELLRQLDNMSEMSPKTLDKLEYLYRKIASTATDKNRGKVSKRDAGLRMLYRAIWDHALRGRRSRVRLRASTINLLLDVNKKFSNPHMEIHLNKILRGRKCLADQINLLIRSRSGKHRRSSVGAPVLDCIPHTLLNAWISSFPGYLFEAVPNRNTSQKYRLLENWLRMLRALDSHIITTPENVGFSSLAFKSLAVYGVKPSAIGHYLMSLDHRTLVNALLQWIPQPKPFHLLPHEAGSTKWYQVSPKIPSHQVHDFVKTYRVLLDKDIESRVSRNELLARLLARMQRQAFPTHEFAKLIFHVIGEHKGIRTVYDILRRLRNKGVGLSDSEFLQEYFGKMLEPLHKQPHTSGHSTRQHNDYTLKYLQSIQALKLEYHDRTDKGMDGVVEYLESRRQLQFIVDSARDAHLLPSVYRGMAPDSLMKIRTELIHQIAYQYSLDRTRTVQENRRSVYYLYKYLRLNKLPIGPLVTRAAIRTNIIHPLLENQFVSSVQLTWVCKLVAHVEGVEVARRIEAIFFAWRGDLIKHAKRSLHAYGGSGKASVSTMKRLGLL
ncbi:hypothetical protein K504DRAFT_508763 [Pleomassaria siparia CBS 279.74]|uniref:Uncharacterized protein n=1 Tax=Pleomassaria siparia CBS 279.74 TaxID=1314801 RepID=A0A6G1JQ25_9PLEO|nr:hypothetical protein K504DRAFT_508763 [Pleomassaria siparia CBS 279.74]